MVTDLPLNVLTDTEATILTIKTFNVPQNILYKAWADPDHIKNWWGPTGFTNTIHIHELKPTGKWSFTMHGPDGRDFPNECVFVKIDEPVQLIWNHNSLPQFQVNVQFERIDDHSTRIIWRMVFPSHEEMIKLKSFIEEKNEENMMRLEAEIGKMK